MELIYWKIYLHQLNAAVTSNEFTWKNNLIYCVANGIGLSFIMKVVTKDWQFKLTNFIWLNHEYESFLGGSTFDNTASGVKNIASNGVQWC